MFDTRYNGDFPEVLQGLQPKSAPEEAPARPPYHVTVLKACANIRVGKTWQKDDDGEPNCTEAYGRLFDAFAANHRRRPLEDCTRSSAASLRAQGT